MWPIFYDPSNKNNINWKIIEYCYSIDGVEVPIPLDDIYDFPSEKHQKFHEWEMQKVNDFIQKLETQFG